MPARRLAEAQEGVQAGAQTVEAGLQQGQDAGRRVVIRGDEGRRRGGRARDDIELRLMSDFCDAQRGEMSFGDKFMSSMSIYTR